MESQSKVTDPNGSISCVGGLSRSQGQRGGGGGGGVGGVEDERESICLHGDVTPPQPA